MDSGEKEKLMLECKDCADLFSTLASALYHEKSCSTKATVYFICITS